jgi:hypothetical protein
MPMWVFAAFLLFTSTSVNLAKTSQKPAVSNQEKPEAILAAAKKASETRAWRVDARIEGDKQMNISGIVAGNDFDLTVETVDGTKRQITLAKKVGSAKTAARTGRTPMQTIVAFIISCTHQSSSPLTKRFRRMKKSPRRKAKLQICCTFV